MLANQVVKQLTNKVCQLTHHSSFLFTLNIKALSSWGKMSTTPRLLMSLLLFTFLFANRRKCKYMT